MNFLSVYNKNIALEYGVRFNEHFIGMLFTEIMTSYSIESGLKHCSAGVTELLLHPCKLYFDQKEYFLPASLSSETDPSTLSPEH